jgi:hypothetical protein
VRDADPDAIVHQGTALADARFGRNFDRTFAQTNRLRTEGTDNLLAAARYNVVDDEPAPEREWLPVLAEALGAKPPRHVPVWLARLIAGEFAVTMGTDARAASNAKAKRELGWTPRYPTWRTGFFIAYASSAPAAEQASHPAAARTHTAA